LGWLRPMVLTSTPSSLAIERLIELMSKSSWAATPDPVMLTVSVTAKKVPSGVETDTL